MVLDEAELAVDFGGGDQGSGLVSLLAVDVKKRRCGLEIGAGQTCVGVGACQPSWISLVEAKVRHVIP